MYFSPQSPALHCSICPRDFFGSWVETVCAHRRSFPTHSQVFQGPFPPYGGIEWPLCSAAMLITLLSLCFSTSLASPHSFCYIEVVLQTAFWLTLVSRKHILSIWFENFFTPQCNWLILLMRLPFPIHSHTLVSLGSGYVTQKFSTLGWFWSAYWLQHLHFFSFSRLFVTTWDFFFLFATSKIPSFYFPLLKSCSFLTSKYNFAIFVLDLDTLLTFTNSTEE